MFTSTRKTARSLTRRAEFSAQGTAPCFEQLEQRALFDAATPVVSLSLIDNVSTEADEDAGRFTIKRTGSTQFPLRVEYSFVGSATPNEDYLGLSGSITIPAGKRAAFLPIIPIDDFDVEGGETVRIALKPTTRYQLDPDADDRAATLTIQDDDRTPIVSLAIADNDASEFGPDDGSFIITRTGPLELSLTVNLRVTGSASPTGRDEAIFGTNADYVALPQRITFAPGVERIELEVDALNDNRLEGNETVRLAVRPGDGYQLETGKVSGLVVIRDRPLVTLFVIDPTATTTTGDDATFLVHRTGPTDKGMRVNFTLGGTGVMGEDFDDLPRFLTFKPGESFITLTISGVNVSLGAPAKTVRVTLEERAAYNLNMLDRSTYSSYITVVDDLLNPAWQA